MTHVGTDPHRRDTVAGGMSLQEYAGQPDDDNSDASTVPPDGIRQVKTRRAEGRADLHCRDNHRRKPCTTTTSAETKPHGDTQRMTAARGHRHDRTNSDPGHDHWSEYQLRSMTNWTSTRIFATPNSITGSVSVDPGSPTRGPLPTTTAASLTPQPHIHPPAATVTTHMHPTTPYRHSQRRRHRDARFSTQPWYHTLCHGPMHVERCTETRPWPRLHAER